MTIYCVPSQNFWPSYSSDTFSLCVAISVEFYIFKALCLQRHTHSLSTLLSLVDLSCTRIVHKQLIHAPGWFRLRYWFLSSLCPVEHSYSLQNESDIHVQVHLQRPGQPVPWPGTVLSLQQLSVGIWDPWLWTWLLHDQSQCSGSVGSSVWRLCQYCPVHHWSVHQLR